MVPSRVGLAAGAGTELSYLEAFRAVCSEGSFTAAARSLGCSQPAVSYQIRKLEEAMGVPLLERTGRRTILTPEGRRVRALADRVLADVARVRSECAAGQRLDPLLLGSASGFGRYVLLPALHALLAERSGEGGPEVRLQYEAADVLLERLADGQYEAAFVYKRTITRSLDYRSAYSEELVLVADHAWSAELGRRDTRRRESLEDIPFVTYEECDYVFGRWFDAGFGSQPARLASRAHFTELEEVLDFVACGVGVSIVPRDAAERYRRPGEIEILRAGAGGPCFNQVYVVTRAGTDLRPPLRRLVDLVEARQDRASRG